MSGKFANSEAVRLRMQGFAGDSVLALEAGLDQLQLNMVEALLLPLATKKQRLNAIEEAKLVLAKAGIAADDAAVMALDAEVAKGVISEEVKP